MIHAIATEPATVVTTVPTNSGMFIILPLLHHYLLQIRWLSLQDKVKKKSHISPDKEERNAQNFPALSVLLWVVYVSPENGVRAPTTPKEDAG